jgi:hypothetical protein
LRPAAVPFHLECPPGPVGHLGRGQQHWRDEGLLLLLSRTAMERIWIGPGRSSTAYSHGAGRAVDRRATRMCR